MIIVIKFQIPRFQIPRFYYSENLYYPLWFSVPLGGSLCKKSLHRVTQRFHRGSQSIFSKF